MRAIITEITGENPNPNNKGATIAAGVPNPAILSMKLPKNQINIMAWTLLSEEREFSRDLICSKSKLFLSTSKKNIAPKIINKMSIARSKPFNEAVNKMMLSTFQNHTEINSVYMNPMVAAKNRDFLSRITIINKMGLRANNKV